MTWHQDDNDIPDDLDAADVWPADGLDRAIASAARDYHAPTSAAPRDAMWAAIVAARIPATPDAAPAVVPALHVERTAVRSLAAERSARADRRRTWWAVAAAAAIFLATGVGIGRWWGAGTVAVQPAGPTTVATREPASSTEAPVPVATPDSATPGTDEPSPVSVSRGAPSPTRIAAAPAPAAARPAGRDPYDIALERHFTQAEALLVSYRRDSVDVALDARLAQWARPLLSNTQLLLDSPAADDPRRRRVLEDLELVLAQVARLAPNAPADSTVAASDSAARAARSDRLERQIIDGTLQRAQLLPRLRNLVASGT